MTISINGLNSSIKAKINKKKNFFTAAAIFLSKKKKNLKQNDTERLII